MTSPLDQIPRLSSLFAASGLEELELRGPAGRLLLRRSGRKGAPDEGADETPAALSPIAVASPGVGHFLRAHPLRPEPLVDVGTLVAAGQALALIRVGALLRPVTAPQAGVVVAIHRDDEALTGFGEALFDLVPEP